MNYPIVSKREKGASQLLVPDLRGTSSCWQAVDAFDFFPLYTHSGSYIMLCSAKGVKGVRI